MCRDARGRRPHSDRSHWHPAGGRKPFALVRVPWPPAVETSTGSLGYTRRLGRIPPQGWPPSASAPGQTGQRHRPQKALTVAHRCRDWARSQRRSSPSRLVTRIAWPGMPRPDPGRRCTQQESRESRTGHTFHGCTLYPPECCCAGRKGRLRARSAPASPRRWQASPASGPSRRPMRRPVARRRIPGA